MDYFFLSYKKVFVTKFVTHVRKFVTHITKFVIHVTRFVTNFFCADSKKYQAESKKYHGGKKNYLRDSSGGHGSWPSAARIHFPSPCFNSSQKHTKR